MNFRRNLFGDKLLMCQQYDEKGAAKRVERGRRRLMQVRVERELINGLRALKKVTLEITALSEFSELHLAIEDRIMKVELIQGNDPSFWMPHIERLRAMLKQLDEAWLRGEADYVEND